jgi:DNA-binding transcriptional LysR family regulator
MRGIGTMFDISLLHCFVTVAEEMHFGRAAERMNMSQSPFSRQIQILEHILDVQLLERKGRRSVKLTPAGQTFLPEARHILQRLNDATLLAKRVALGKTGLLKIGFTAMTAVGVLPRLVAGFRETFPNAELHLQEASSTDQLQRLHLSEIDIAIVRPHLPRTMLESLCLSSEPLVAAIPTTHALAAKSKITLRDFNGQPFISYLPSQAYYLCAMVEDLLATADVTPNYIQRLTHVHAIIAQVDAGIGLSIVPNGARLFNFSNVVLRPIADPQPKAVELFMVWRADNLNPLVPKMAELVRSIVSAQKEPLASCTGSFE